MTRTAATGTETDSPDRGTMARGEILEILARHDSQRGSLIAVLEDIQARCGYLPEQALRTVSQETGRSLVDIYGIATFYRAFSLVPRGRHLVCACLGTACHVRGAPRVVDELVRHLGIQPGQTTPDGEFTLETVNCLGACALGPVVVIDGRYFSKVKTSGIARLLDQAAAGFGPTDGGREGAFPLEASCPLCNHSLMDEGTRLDGLASIRIMVVAEGVAGLGNCSALLGSGTMICPEEVPDQSVCEVFCPRCHGSLTGGWTCRQCGAPMARLAVKGGGMVHVCQRRSCRGQRLDLECVNG